MEVGFSWIFIADEANTSPSNEKCGVDVYLLPTFAERALAHMPYEIIQTREKQMPRSYLLYKHVRMTSSE